MTGRIVGLLLAALVLIAGVVLASTPTPNQGFKDAAAALAVITATAVGIERLIEGFWTAVGLLKGTWWPLNLFASDVDAYASDLSGRLANLVTEANQAADAAAKAQNWAEGRLTNVQQDLLDLKTKVDNFQKLAPGNERVQLITAAGKQVISYATDTVDDPQVQAAARSANIALSGLEELAKSFQDNPGRRLISIYAGSILGLVVAGFLGLDLFQAASASVGGSSIELNLGVWRHTLHLTIGLTGLVLGLGSNPTHEVIRAIQEYKRFKKTQ